MLRDIFTFLKRLVLSFVLFVFVAIPGFFSGLFLCDFLKATSIANSFCINNGAMLGVLISGIIISILLFILSKKQKISTLFLILFIIWLILGCHILSLQWYIV